MSLITVFKKFDKPLGYTKAIIPSEDAEYYLQELGFTRTIPVALQQKETVILPEIKIDKRSIEEKRADPEAGWGVPGSELWNLRHLDELNAKKQVIDFIKEITHFTIKLESKTLPVIKLEAAKLLKSHHASN